VRELQDHNQVQDQVERERKMKTVWLITTLILWGYAMVQAVYYKQFDQAAFYMSYATLTLVFSTQEKK